MKVKYLWWDQVQNGKRSIYAKSLKSDCLEQERDGGMEKKSMIMTIPGEDQCAQRQHGHYML